jgi:hypothetical protein
MLKELTTSTGLLGKVIQESIEPLRYELFCIIQELLGQHVSEQQAMLCQMSIMAQCLNLTIQEQRRKAFAAAGVKTGLLPENFTIEEIADHIIHFSLAGIQEIKHQSKMEQLAH